ncbi:LAME_0F07668g1_1 [Lachancea meyersii CBS 8951]|uniref:DNA topoisomerase (ATP-hydrolyzing) n=1 Tax=Lachancea meyersii CBS 8951 TaxID=1266667 RepID=A0A1G4JU73_9SACH|nr:LAME_0F07668g1_1 [Lachancea meyersii CBS 8951]
MKTEHSLTESLREYMNHNPTRKDLTDALTPRTRDIKLTKLQPSQSLESEIETLLSLARNGIEQHNEPVVLIIEWEKRTHKLKMNYPYHGFETLKDPPAMKIAVLLSLLSRISAIAKSRDICTIRDVFYLNVELYKSQQIVSESLRDIAESFQLSDLNALGIVAAQKGLCCTPVELSFDIDKLILKNQKSLVPLMTPTTELSGNWSLVKRVVVLEKDAIFSKLAENPLINQQCILVTGKGFPDWLTRHFLYKMMLSCPPTVLFEIYTDSDPYGIEIALKYIYNDVNTVYQCPRLVYRGVMIQDLLQSGDTVHRGLQLLDLSARDLSYAMNLLKRLVNTTLKASKKRLLMREVQRQMFYQKKAEMNTVHGADFAKYLVTKSGTT